jgi:hypothetical protein
MRHALLMATITLFLSAAGCAPSKVDSLPPENVMNPRGT